MLSQNRKIATFFDKRSQQLASTQSSCCKQCSQPSKIALWCVPFTNFLGAEGKQKKASDHLFKTNLTHIYKERLKMKCPIPVSSDERNLQCLWMHSQHARYSSRFTSPVARFLRTCMDRSSKEMDQKGSCQWFLSTRKCSHLNSTSTSFLRITKPIASSIGKASTLLWYKRQ